MSGFVAVVVASGVAVVRCGCVFLVACIFGFVVIGWCLAFVA